MDQTKLDNIIIALLFASDEPLSLRKVSSVLDDRPIEEIREAIARIGEKFRGDDSVMQLEQVAGGYQLSTNAAYSDYIALLYRGRRKQRLSKAAMETLAIIAYKQPVTRADIENLRGVGCGGVITTLMERTLIKIMGKAKVLGSPFLYGTTQEFLEYLGLNNLGDLPSMEDLEALLELEVAGEAGFENGDQASLRDGLEGEAETQAEAEDEGLAEIEDPVGQAGAQDEGSAGHDADDTGEPAAHDTAEPVDPVARDIEKPLGADRQGPTEDLETAHSPVLDRDDKDEEPMEQTAGQPSALNSTSRTVPTEGSEDIPHVDEQEKK